MKQQRTNAQNNVDREHIQTRVERLVSAATSLTHAIEMLSSSQLLGDMRPDVSRGVNFYEEVTRFEVSMIETAMRFTRGNQVHAAALLGLNHTTLNSKIKRYKIDRRVFSTYFSSADLSDLQEKFYGALVDGLGPSVTA
jgi:DNA-binding protein Fis